MARDVAVAIGHVVVGQLFAFADSSRRADPDRVANDVDVAVGMARVVDEARDVAAHGRVAHPPPIDLKTPDQSFPDVSTLTLQAFLVRDLLTRIIDDPLVLVDPFRGEHSPPV